MAIAKLLTPEEKAEIIRDCGEIKEDTAYMKDESTGLWREVTNADYIKWESRIVNG